MLPEEVLGTPPSRKTYELWFPLPTRHAGTKVVRKLWEWATNDWSSLKPILWGSPQCLTGQDAEVGQPRELKKTQTCLIKHIKKVSEMILCDILLFIDRCLAQLLSEALHLVTDTEAHSKTLGRPHRILWKWGGRIMRARRARDSTGKYRDNWPELMGAHILNSQPEN